MTDEIYKVVPAPTQGKKAKGAKSTPDRFALALTDILNEMAADGWVYVRAETLPCDERKGLTGTQTTFQNVLVFKKAEVAVETAILESAEIIPPAKPSEPLVMTSDDLPRHADADPLSAALGDTLRATRASDAPTSRRLGPADAD